MDVRSHLGPITAIAISCLAGVWLYAGGNGVTQAQANDESINAEPVNDNNSPQSNASLPSVQVTTLTAQEIQNHLTLSAETVAETTLELTNQVAGNVTKVFVQKGDYLNKGDAIIEIDTRSLKANLAQAEALVTQRKLQLQGTQRLQNQNLTSQVSVATARTELESAQASLTALRIELENATVRAPFSGVLNQFEIKPGQWLVSNALVGELVDVTPLRILVDVPQIDLPNIVQGTQANVTFSTGQTVTSDVSYVSVTADSATRTVPVELQVTNNAPYIPAGISAQVVFTLNSIKAHGFSPALLEINAAGNMSVKTVDDTNTVRAKEVTIVRSDRERVWVTGLPDQVNVITVGQGFVADGDAVSAHYDD